MTRYRPIFIGCPQYRVLVRGEYESDESGRYRAGADGAFVLGRLRCRQYGGRCMQTLCALHRYNRQGCGSWYPAGLLAMPERRRPPAPGAPSERSDGSWLA